MRPTWSAVDVRQLDVAIAHVLEGRQIVAQQHALLARLRQSGLPTDNAERLLASFESTLRSFEDEYERMLAERQKAKVRLVPPVRPVG